MKCILSITLTILFFGIAHAQVQPGSELYNTMKTNDSLLFNVGFNTCEMSVFDKLRNRPKVLSRQSGNHKIETCFYRQFQKWNLWFKRF